MTKTKRNGSAADAFRSYYAKQYGERWPVLHAALLAPTRYAALVNRYAPMLEFNALLEASEFDPTGLQQLQFPDIAGTASVAAYTLSANDSYFPAPILTNVDLLSHWNLDAASLLVVHFLAIRPGDRVLDLCAAPGGKSVAIAQSIWPHLHADSRTPSVVWRVGCLHSNELGSPRNKRLAENLKAYLPAPLFSEGCVKLLRIDATTGAKTFPLGYGGYDKILVDAPCSSERHLLHAQAKAEASGRAAEEMTRWSPGSSKRLAKTQSELLMTALKAVRLGGLVLYATCSLSNEENDGVIDKVMAQLGKDRKKGSITWTAKLELERTGLETWAECTKSGCIVMPDHPNGGRWGPLFFAVLTKVGNS